MVGRWLVLVVVALGMCGAETDAERLARLEAENAALRERVGVLEGVVAEIKGLLTGPAPATKPAVRAKFETDIYGYVKLDSAYDSQGGPVGNVSLWVDSEARNDGDDQFTMTPRQSRLGLAVRGPKLGGANSSGRVEVDFYGEGTENKEGLMLRHAYLQLDWPRQRLSLLAGQNWDVISPLFPQTLNFSVGGDVGNLAYRRPQLRLTKGFDLGPSADGELQVALTRTIGRAAAFAPPADTGGDSGFPTVQSRFGVDFPLAGRRASVGVSGHWGEEEFHRDATAAHWRAETWSANVDATLPVTDRLTVTGEAWVGANLHTYLGGIGQGVHPDTFAPIRSAGGWVNVGFGPFGRSRFNLGAGLDDPIDRDLPAAGRRQNSTIYGNCLYDFGSNLQGGAELSYWKTLYQDQTNGDSLRAQLSLLYGF